MERAITAKPADVSLAGTPTLSSESEAGTDHHLYSGFWPQLLHWFRVLARCTVRVVSAANRLEGEIDTHRMETRNSSGIGIRRLGL